MIFEIEDLLDELHEEFPQITRASISKICKTGISRTRQFAKYKTNLSIRAPEKKEYIVFRPQNKESYNKRPRKKAIDEG